MDEDTTPGFARGFRLRHDGVRDQWVVLGPERAFVADPIAAEILRRIDGGTSFGAIISALAEMFAAPRAEIAVDVLGMADELAGKGVLVVVPGG